MKTSKKFSLLCISAALSLCVSAFADDLKHRDHEFVEKAAKSGMEEVTISRIAAERTQNPQIKEFASMMVSDHGGANTELKSIAMTKAVTLPEDKTSIDKWNNRSAKDFDQEYIDKMVSDHKDAVDLFDKEAKSGADPELKAFAQKTLPTLMAHLDKAKLLKSEMK